MTRAPGGRWTGRSASSRGARLAYDARSWTEGEEEGSTIHHVNDLTLSPEGDGTTSIRLHVAITSIGPKAKMAAFGMKWGYKQQLDQLGELLGAAEFSAD